MPEVEHQPNLIIPLLMIAPINWRLVSLYRHLLQPQKRLASTVTTGTSIGPQEELVSQLIARNEALLNQNRNLEEILRNSTAQNPVSQQSDTLIRMCLRFVSVQSNIQSYV